MLKRQNDYLLNRHEFARMNPNVPLYLLTFRNLGELSRRAHLELVRFLFEENIKVVRLSDGVGCFNTDDLERIDEWREEHIGFSPIDDAAFPGFIKMHDDIRDTSLRIAKFDLFYGLVEPPAGVPSDEFVNFYCSVINSMTGRFYGVKQSFGDVNFIDERNRNVWVFYFENENDHLVFSGLVDIEIEQKTGLFVAPPKPATVVTFTDIATASYANNSVLMMGGSTLNFAPPPKTKITGNLTHNPDGTVTIETV